jgi:hypothetical protein
MTFSGSATEKCLNCEEPIKLSYAYCPDCGFYWGNAGKNVLAKLLKKFRLKNKNREKS